MGTQKLKAAVISAGMIANSGHIPAYKAFSQDVSLEAVCDLNASAARDTALRHDIPRCTLMWRGCWGKGVPDSVFPIWYPSAHPIPRTRDWLRRR